MERIPLRPIGVAATAGLAVIALTVFLRRVSGAPLRDLVAGEAVVYAAFFAVAAMAAIGFAIDGVARDRRLAAVTAVAALLLTLVFVAGVSSVAATTFVCIVAVVGVVGFGLLAAPSTALVARRDAERDQTHSEADADVLPAVEEVGNEALRLVRSIAEGTEHLEGSIRFEVAPGETAKTLHVPLWPPLAAAPTVTCELGGIEGRVRVPFAKPHGFRIEVRLPEAIDEPLSGVVRFNAECPQRFEAA